MPYFCMMWSCLSSPSSPRQSSIFIENRSRSIFFSSVILWPAVFTTARINSSSLAFFVPFPDTRASWCCLQELRTHRPPNSSIYKTFHRPDYALSFLWVLNPLNAIFLSVLMTSLSCYIFLDCFPAYLFFSKPWTNKESLKQFGEGQVDIWGNYKRSSSPK